MKVEWFLQPFHYSSIFPFIIPLRGLDMVIDLENKTNTPQCTFNTPGRLISYRKLLVGMRNDDPVLREVYRCIGRLSGWQCFNDYELDIWLLDTPPRVYMRHRHTGKSCCFHLSMEDLQEMDIAVAQGQLTKLMTDFNGGIILLSGKTSRA